MDYLKAIRVVCAAARRESFAQAAVELGISPTSASRIVREFETLLGTRLFNRSTREIALTDSGRVLVTRATHCLREIDDLIDDVRELNEKPIGALRVAAPVTYGHWVLTPAIAKFLQAYPKITVELVFDNAAPSLIDEQIDLGVLISQPRDSRLVARKIDETADVLCASPTYVNQFGRPENPKEIQNHNCIVYSRRYRPERPWTFVDSGGSVSSVTVGGNLTVDSCDAAFTAVRDGLGIGFLPDYSIQHELRSGDLVPLLTDFKSPRVPIYAVFLRRELMAKRLRLLLEFLYKGMQE